MDSSSARWVQRSERLDIELLEQLVRRDTPTRESE
jgi:hypothetical protein